MDKLYEKSQTPATPAISLMVALNQPLDDMKKEGFENRFNRHLAMAEHVRSWANRYFRIYGDNNYLSHTVTNVENTRSIDISGLNKELGLRGAEISNGYADLKDICFRIGHMGDLSLSDIQWLTNQIDEILGLG